MVYVFTSDIFRKPFRQRWLTSWTLIWMRLAESGTWERYRPKNWDWPSKVWNFMSEAPFTLKNHRVTSPIATMPQLLVWLHHRPCVFVKSWNRVHHSGFFWNNAAMTVSKLQSMVDSGEFYAVESKESIQRARIRSVVVHAAAILGNKNGRDL